jgi:hypothetical protein
VSTACEIKRKSMQLFHFLFSTGVCGLETMQNPFYTDSVTATASQPESENELVNFSGHLPSTLTAQMPSVVVEDSADVHVGPHLQYHGPVTVKQYVTVKGKDDGGSLAGNPSKNIDSTTPQPSEGAHAVGMYSRVIQKHLHKR